MSNTPNTNHNSELVETIRAEGKPLFLAMTLTTSLLVISVVSLLAMAALQ